MTHSVSGHPCTACGSPSPYPSPQTQVCTKSAACYTLGNDADAAADAAAANAAAAVAAVAATANAEPDNPPTQTTPTRWTLHPSWRRGQHVQLEIDHEPYEKQPNEPLRAVQLSRGVLVRPRALQHPSHSMG